MSIVFKLFWVEHMKKKRKREEDFDLAIVEAKIQRAVDRFEEGGIREDEIQECGDPR